MSSTDDHHPLDALFPRPSDEDRERRRHDLVNRARLVQAHGWDDYRYVWSSGEVAGVSYLLGDEDVLTDAGETTDSVLSRYAYDLFGLAGGRSEDGNGYQETKLWFTHAHDNL